MSIDKVKNMSFYINGLSDKTSQELVKTLAANGARLFLSDQNKEILRKSEEKISKMDCNAHYLLVDPKDSYQVENVINKAFNSLKTLDVAINNFSLQTIPTNIIDCSVDYLFRSCISGLSSVFLLMKYEISLMLGLQSKGTIINIFSSNGKIDFMNSHATIAYLHAIKGLTMSTADSYSGNGIRIKSFYVQNENRDSQGAKRKPKYAIVDLAGPLGNKSIENIVDKVLDTLFCQGQ